MLRLWREKCGPKWPCVKPRSGQPPLAAVAYSKNDRHEGRIYRFDGWAADRLEKVVADDLWPLPKYSEILFIK